MVDRGIALQTAQGLHAHTAIFADTSKIISKKIDNHDILGSVLGTGKQLVSAGRVLLRARPPRRGPLDWPSFDGTALHLEKPLRRGAGNGPVAQIEIACKRRGIAGAQTLIDGKRGVLCPRQQPLGDINLKTIAGMGVFNRPAQDLEIRLAVEVAVNTVILVNQVMGRLNTRRRFEVV